MHPMTPPIILAAALSLLVASPGKATVPELPELGDTASQLALDITPVPHGMGAVFVPSASRPELEPTLHVFAGEERIASGPTAKRIPLPPGRYEVVAGQGPMDWRARHEVVVEAGRTVVADGFFGALRVTAIDPFDRPIKARYALVAADGGRVYGPERTSGSEAYGSTRTWVLPPGRYNVVLGGDAAPRENRVALLVPAGGRIAYRLVVDDGRLVRSEFADRPLVLRDDIWRLDWVFGGAGALDKTERQLGGFSGDALRVEIFTRFEAGLDLGDHLALLRIGIEESWIGLEHAIGKGLPFQKLTDVLQAEVLYNYRLAEIIGPYVRGRVRTSAFPTTIYPEVDTTVEVLRADGTSDTFDAAAGDEVSLMKGFAPTTFQAGGGMAVTAWDDDLISLIVRGGVAGREDYYGTSRGRYVADSGPGTLVLQELDRQLRFGVELTANLRLRLGEIVSLQSTFEAFSSFDELGGSETLRPSFIWDSAVTLRLSSWAQVVYAVALHRDDQRLPDTQLRQSLSLRFQYSVF
ncbi:MAG: hypothetical protein CVU56_20880 [Deltaproteobacteria bacterium HGW-Deltaproteobacteria-14]|jgi:hypothetical protein|nr:MAG: hypothetical protein CVU56_20880 [Deltaproteobacteria bacterium HGW-Deltaproteobacteria-14]